MTARAVQTTDRCRRINARLRMTRSEKLSPGSGVIPEHWPRRVTPYSLASGNVNPRVLVDAGKDVDARKASVVE